MLLSAPSALPPSLDPQAACFHPNSESENSNRVVTAVFYVIVIVIFAVFLVKVSVVIIVVVDVDVDVVGGSNCPGSPRRFSACVISMPHTFN